MLSRLLFAQRRAPALLQARGISATSARFSSLPQESQLDGERTIHSKLTEKFAPSQLQVQDISGMYASIEKYLLLFSLAGQADAVASTPSQLRARHLKA